MEEEVVSTNSWTYHRPDCHTIRYSYGLTRFKSWIGAVSEGMAPCGVCYPRSGQIVGKVIGDGHTYHWPDCRILENVERYLMKTFQSWDGAVTEGLKPCRVCDPTFISLEEEEIICGINTYHRPRCPLLKYVDPSHIDRFPSWEEAEAEYKKPCVLCRPSSSILKKEPTPPTAAPAKKHTSPSEDVNAKTKETIADPTKYTITKTDDADPTVSVDQISNWRRRLVQLVGRIDQERDHSMNEGLAAKISRLSREKVIPRHVAAYMKTITEMRNIVEYESKTLSPRESQAVRAAWDVIEEWAQVQQLDL